MSAFAYSDRVARQDARSLQELKYLSVGRTDMGCVRKLNEDGFLNRPDIGLWAVADGMGGHAAGDVASQMVIGALGRISQVRSAYALRSAVNEALRDVNAALVRKATQLEAGPIGSTIVALMAHGNHYACVWAGDSRIYLYRNGVMRQLTRDHSYVQGLIDRGELDEASARTHGAANVITRAVGADAVLELESVHGAIEPGDRFLLCSDGLSNVCHASELEQHVRRAPLERGLDGLITLALSRGAPDNVTAIIACADRRAS
jgi:serine/threonine protein phosphatase PrpC